MAAPSKTTRVTPSGYPMKDGYRSLVTLSAVPGATFWEKDVTHSGIDGGDPIPYSNMHNGTWHTQRPRSLKKGTDITIRAAFYGTTLETLNTYINVEQTISQFFPSTHWVAFFGYLRSAIPQSHQEGSPPECQLVICPTMWDYVNSVEAGPAFGTGL